MKNNQVSIKVSTKTKQMIAKQNSVIVSNQAFCQILSWLDAPATTEQAEGIKRLQTTDLPWSQE